MKTEDRWLTTTEIKKTSKISLGYEMPDLGLGSLETADYSAQFYFQTPVETDASGHLSKPQVLFTGKVRIVFEGANNAFKAVLHLNSERIYSSVEWIDAELTVNFPANLEEYFSACSHSSLVLHGLFRSGTWVNKYGVHNLGTIENVGLFDLKEPVSQLTLHREEQLKHIFINNLCGGENSGQMPTICREIASNLVNTWTNDRHLELLTTAFDLLTGLRFINTNLDGDMEEKRNSEVSLEQTDFS